MRTDTIRTLALLLLGLAALPATAYGEDDRTLDLPQAGLSVRAPSDWRVEQYDTAVLKLVKQGATLWFYAREGARADAEAPLRRLAERSAAGQPGGAAPRIHPWKVPGARAAHQVEYFEGEDQRFFGVIDRGESGFDVEGLTPKKADDTLHAELQTILESVDARPYEHADRLVDYTYGFTIDGVADWKQQLVEDSGVRLGAPETRAAIRVVPAPTSSSDPRARIDRVLESAYGRLRKAGFTVTPKAGPDGSTLTPFTLERTHAEPLEGVRVVVGIGRPDPQGELTLEAVLDGDLVVLWIGQDSASVESGRDRAKTFRLGAHPGPRASDGAKRGPDRFPTDKGPALRFDLPGGWRVGPADRKMGIATFTPADGLDGVAYWFDGRGGSLEANVERWKGQWSGDPVVTTHEGKGVKTTVLRFEGTHRGMGPHGSGGDATLAGVLAYIEIEGGPMTLKLVGTPEQLTDDVVAAFNTWVASYRLAQ